MLSKVPGYEKFQQYMKDKDFSYNSCEAYKKDIDDFFIFIQYKPLNDITENNVLTFIKDLKKFILTIVSTERSYLLEVILNSSTKMV